MQILTNIKQQIFDKIHLNEWKDLKYMSMPALKPMIATIGKKLFHRLVHRFVTEFDLRGSDPGEYVVVNMSLVLMQARSVGIWTWACQDASDGSALSP